MKKIIYCILFLNYTFSIAQNNFEQESKRDLNFSIQNNPSVYEFTKYGNIPVNEYRGLANVSIPLYDVDVDELNIPLKLNYYTGGIKVSEEAGIVGLGWSLNLPTIFQTINDEDDLDVSVIKFNDLPAYTGSEIFITRGAIHPSLPVSSGTYCNSGGQHIISNVPSYFAVSYDNLLKKDGHYICNTLDSNYANQIVFGQYHDSEADIFNLSLEGVNIEFSTKMVNNNLTFLVINGRTEFQIFKENNGFKIISPSGNKYFFEIHTKIETNSYGLGFFDIIRNGNSSYSSVGNYFQKIFRITKIITNKNKIVEFEYITNDVKELLKKSYNYYKKLNLTTVYSNTIGYEYFDGYSREEPGIVGVSTPNTNGVTNFFGFGTIGSNNPDLGIIPQQDDYRWTTNYTNQHQNYHFIKKITSESEEINFTYENRIDYEGMKKLTSINIKNLKGESIKNIVFNYSYFGNQADYYNLRLKLDSLQINNDNSYTFEYNSTSLPPKDSNKIDYWGYYNGHNNTNLFPNLQELGYSYSDNSQNSFMANINYAKAGSLEKIIYPTGGISVFDYELHEFSNFIQFDGIYDNSIYNGNLSNVQGGGLRIKKIRDYTENDVLSTEKSYHYIGGKNIFRKKLARQYSTSVVKMQDILPCTENHAVNFITYRATILEASLNSAYGSSIVGQEDYIGYDSVEIKEIGVVGKGKLIKSFYNYSFDMFIPTQSKNFTPLYFSNGENILNGNLKEEKIYDNSSILKLSKNYTYQTKTINPILGLYGVKVSGYDYLNSYYCNICNNSFYCSLVVVPNSILTSYPIKGYSSYILSEKTINYFPSGSKLTTTEYQYDLNNILTGKKVKNQSGQYFYEESSSMASTPDLITKNILNFPAWTSIKENGTLVKYSQYLYTTLSNSVLPSKIEELPEGNPDPSKKINVFYDMYDDKSNLIQYHKENDIYTCIIWGYNKTLPVAKIENVQYATITAGLITDVQDKSNTGTEAQLLTALENLRNSLPNAFITTYTHKPLIGVSTITDSKGDKITYHYDSNNRLQFVKDKNGNILNENKYNFRPHN